MPRKRKVSERALGRLTIEYQLKNIAKSQTKQKSNSLGSTLAEFTDEEPLNNIKAFVNCVYKGETPPPNVLARIAEFFDTYLGSEDNSLDYSFGLLPKPKIGHPIQYRKDKDRRGDLFHEMWILRKEAKESGGKISIPNAAQEVLNSNNIEDITVDALDRAYRDEKAEKTFDEMYESLIKPLIRIGRKSGK